VGEVEEDGPLEMEFRKSVWLELEVLMRSERLLRVSRLESWRV
jgi:hypothetical protein